MEVVLERGSVGRRAAYRWACFSSVATGSVYVDWRDESFRRRHISDCGNIT